MECISRLFRPWPVLIARLLAGMAGRCDRIVAVDGDESPPAAPFQLCSLARLILPALLVMVMLLSACAQPARDNLSFGLASMPVTLDPRFATDAASSRIIRLLYQSLVEFDDSVMPQPALAEWEQVSATLYRFDLENSAARFSNGAQLTAADVKATYDFIMNEENGSPHRLSFENIETISTAGGHIVNFQLKRADPLFPGRLTIGILPRDLIEADHSFNRVPVGSGPFELVAWPDEGRLILRRRHDAQVLEFVSVSDPTVRILKLLRGEIDMAQNDLPPELVEHLRGREGIRIQQGRGSNFAYLGFNLRDDITGSLEMRRAIAHALDREAIIRHVFGESARLAGAILPPEHWAGVSELQGFPYDPEYARRLLDEMGYGDGDAPRIVYKTSTDPFRVRLATIIQRQLTEAGFEVELRSYDWGTFYGDIQAGNFQMYSLMWVGVKLPEIFRYAFHSAALPPAGANRGYFTNTVADTLIEQAEGSATIEDQVEPLKMLQHHLHAKLPYVPLWYENHVFVAHADIVGYEIALDGNYDSLVRVTRASAD